MAMSSKAPNKREIPSALQKLLAADAYLTNKFCNWADNFLPLRSLRIHYKVLEISCHGIPWIVGWIAFIWLMDMPSLYQMQVNFLIGLLLDIIFVGVIKAVTRRRRPSANQNDMMFARGPDKYSFPSGHVSRACFIANFFIWLYPVSLLLYPPLLAWSTTVSISRILMRRHHLLDVVAGAALGYFEALLISWIWVPEWFAVWLITWLSDEKLDGGSYHV